MKIVGVIPARYQSSRFPGKPLADICGKPMIWWVYQQVMQVKKLEKVYVATDDKRIEDVCKQYDMNVEMTSERHRNHVERLYEVSQNIDADLYVCVCGDEPLMMPQTIEKVVLDNSHKNEKVIVRGIMRKFTDPVETIDPGNIKITTNSEGICINLSRSPIPFPYKTLNFSYKKIVGVECYNKNALEMFYNWGNEGDIGELEKIEDIVLMRFLEHKISIRFIMDDQYTLSVDTPKDLEKVIKIIGERK